MMHTRNLAQSGIGAGAALIISLLSAQGQQGWVVGDFHQHTLHTDGTYPMATVFASNSAFGLNWWANSEHGGRWTVYRWQDLLGSVETADDGQINSFAEVLYGRTSYPDKVIFQGLEWNVPQHEHCSMGIIVGQFDAEPSNYDLAQFEYFWDAADTDTSGGPGGYWTGKNTVNTHAKAVAAAEWVNAYFPYTAWMVVGHPERYAYNGSVGWNIEHLRDMNNAAPTVFFGFEGIPGHQRASNRGEYRVTRPSVGGTTYGGCGAYAAFVGGLWDALLGEGRHFWLFANSDFHNPTVDHWPGEYLKNHTYVADMHSPQAIVDGMRSGNTWVAQGDLIDHLEFGATSGIQSGVMGEDVQLFLGNTGTGRILRAANVTLRVEFSSPVKNNAPAPFSNVPRVDHIDIIAGQINGIVAPESPGYTSPTNVTTRVIARYYNPDSGLTPAWSVDPVSGKNVINVTARISKNTYFRLRGSNLQIGVDTLDIGANGSPLGDDINPAVGDAEAWTDLWFYSNPIFVYMNTK